MNFFDPNAHSSELFAMGGMGHLVLVHEDLQAMESFYTTVGFDVTERLHAKVGPISIDGTFMHCNRRHHSLALFHLPSGKRLHHFMLQARDHIDVGRAYECVFRTIVTDRFGIVTAEFGNVTGDSGNVTDHFGIVTD